MGTTSARTLWYISRTTGSAGTSRASCIPRLLSGAPQGAHRDAGVAEHLRGPRHYSESTAVLLGRDQVERERGPGEIVRALAVAGDRIEELPDAGLRHQVDRASRQLVREVIETV